MAARITARGVRSTCKSWIRASRGVVQTAQLSRSTARNGWSRSNQADQHPDSFNKYRNRVARRISEMLPPTVPISSPGKIRSAHLGEPLGPRVTLHAEEAAVIVGRYGRTTHPWRATSRVRPGAAATITRSRRTRCASTGIAASSTGISASGRWVTRPKTGSPALIILIVDAGQNP